jgi:hypothetical protein
MYQFITKFDIVLPNNWAVMFHELKTCPHRNLYLNIYSNFIYNYQNLEAIKIPLNDKWINNHGTTMHKNITQQYKWFIMPKNGEKFDIYIHIFNTEWKKPIWKSYTTSYRLYDILEKAKLFRRKKKKRSIVANDLGTRRDQQAELSQFL